MNLKSGSAFWSTRNGLPAAYPRLTRDAAVEVAVLGAGITGAIIADRLVQEGHEVLVLDGREAACGSTSASTAMIQYEIDTPMTELATLYGERAAVAAYRAGVDAVATLAALDASVGGRFLTPRKSFYVASKPEDDDALRAEFELRHRHGLAVELWEQAKIEREFDFSASLGVLSAVGAELDPHGMAHALLARVAQKNRVYDRTPVERLEPTADGVALLTADGPKVTCRQLVVAAGYESLKFLPPIRAALHSTYALVSEPLAAFPGWYERCLLWETARPYSYFRTTDDDRLLAGGQDSAIQNATVRKALAGRRLAAIEAEARRRFPRLDFAVDYAWNGTFAETFDGLPFIGPHRERPGTHLFALCFGGNGITYSVIAAGMIAAALGGKTHPLTDLFGFDREARIKS